MCIVLGIDPGKKTGIALFRKGKIDYLDTVTPQQILDIIEGAYPDLVVMEDSRLQTYFARNGQNQRGNAKIARNVGEIDAQCRQIEALCKENSIRLIMLSPKQKGSKLDKEQFRELTGWAGRSNQHERDAGVLAWRYRKIQIS